MADGNIRISYELDSKKAESNLKKLNNLGLGVDKAFSKLKSTYSETFTASNILKTATNALTYSFSELLRTTTAYLSESANLSADMLGYRNAIQLVAGTQEQATKQLKQARDIAVSLKIDIVTLTKQYSKFVNAMVLAGSSVEQSTLVFKQFSTAARVLNLNTQRTEGMFLALEQMVSKGRVSMEELRRQLGEHIPGALNLAAKAMGYSTDQLGDFIKEVSNGNVVSKELVTNLGKLIYDKTFKLLPVALQKYSASVIKLKNAFTELKLIFGEFFSAVAGPIIETFAEWVDAFNNMLGGPKIFQQELAQLQSEIEPMTSSFNTMKDGVDSIAAGMETMNNATASMGAVMASTAGTVKNYSNALKVVAGILSPILLKGITVALTTMFGVMAKGLGITTALWLAGAAAIKRYAIALGLLRGQSTAFTAATAAQAAASAAAAKNLTAMSAAANGVFTGGVIKKSLTLKDAMYKIGYSAGTAYVSFLRFAAAITPIGALVVTVTALGSALLKVATQTNHNSSYTATYIKDTAELADKAKEAAGEMKTLAHEMEKVGKTKLAKELADGAKQMVTISQVSVNANQTLQKYNGTLENIVLNMNEWFGMFDDAANAIKQARAAAIKTYKDANKKIAENNERTKESVDLAQKLNALYKERQALAAQELANRDLDDITFKQMLIGLSEDEIEIMELRRDRQTELLELQEKNKNLTDEEIAQYHEKTEAMVTATQNLQIMTNGHKAAQEQSKAFTKAIKEELKGIDKLSEGFKKEADELKKLTEIDTEKTTYDLKKLFDSVKTNIGNGDFETAYEDLKKFREMAGEIKQQNPESSITKNYVDLLSSQMQKVASDASGMLDEIADQTRAQFGIEFDTAEVQQAAQAVKGVIEQYIQENKVRFRASMNVESVNASTGEVINFEDMLKPRTVVNKIVWQHVEEGKPPTGASDFNVKRLAEKQGA